MRVADTCIKNLLWDLPFFTNYFHLREAFAKRSNNTFLGTSIRFSLKVIGSLVNNTQRARMQHFLYAEKISYFIEQIKVRIIKWLLHKAISNLIV